MYSPRRHFCISYPSPKKLSDVVKLPLLRLKSREEVAKIWAEHFRTKTLSVAASTGHDAFERLASTAQVAPHFVVPLPRGEGGASFETFFIQFQGSRTCLITSLHEYTQLYKNPDRPSPFLVVTFFDELGEEKNLTLIQGDILRGECLSKEEAGHVLSLLLLFYSDPNLSRWVLDFNLKPREFSFELFQDEQRRGFNFPLQVPPSLENSGDASPRPPFFCLELLLGSTKCRIATVKRPPRQPNERGNSPESRRATTGCSGRICVWQTKTRKSIIIAGPVSSVCVHGGVVRERKADPDPNHREGFPRLQNDRPQASGPAARKTPGVGEKARSTPEVLEDTGAKKTGEEQATRVSGPAGATDAETRGHARAHEREARKENLQASSKRKKHGEPSLERLSNLTPVVVTEAAGESSDAEDAVIDETDAQDRFQGTRALNGTLSEQSKTRTRSTSRPPRRRIRSIIGVLIGAAFALWIVYRFKRSREEPTLVEKRERASALQYIIGRRNAALLLAGKLCQEMEQVKAAIEFQAKEAQTFERHERAQDYGEAMETKEALEKVYKFLSRRQMEAEKRATRLITAEQLLSRQLDREGLEALPQEEVVRFLSEGRLDEARSHVPQHIREADQLREAYVPGVVQMEQNLERLDPQSDEYTRLRRDLTEMNRGRLPSALEQHVARISRNLPIAMDVPLDQIPEIFADPGPRPESTHIRIANELLGVAPQPEQG
ncbi:GM04207p, related [Neospora caninum Liverpool]|uniref:GM04207p, related n=1 Tax=Neospora caninum (strain Liverpool) TaxID=572307 RepID=F0VD10_NEOCL|nr:GM04207p, related [Neospora caninum Liverpool]CBZ51525.1 GM04207p, related [Neospora caninum Liverpool]CEL65474.1 TPA: GM04207p, related [Neospora caninum Liverpool]|eukprot:XP_003881558.1 GM04207p, related [Neospora caninum Liverpool]